MRNVGIIVLTLLVLLVTEVDGQSVHFGVKAGANFSEITGRSFDGGFQAGFTGGAYAELGIGGKWELQPELLYTQAKATTSNEFYYASDPQFQGIPNRSVTLNYLNIPVLLSYKIIPILSIQAGPVFGILMNTSQNLMTNPNQNAFKSTDFLVAGGAQLNLSKVKLGIRYSYGLSDISAVTPTDTWKNQNIQIYLGVTLF
jgi:hypothetical protein